MNKIMDFLFPHRKERERTVQMCHPIEEDIDDLEATVTQLKNKIHSERVQREMKRTGKFVTNEVGAKV